MRKLRRLRRARKAGRFGLWSVVSVSVLAAFVGALLLLIIDQTLRAPEWVRDRVEMRLEENIGGLQLDFGAVELVIGNGWRPRAALRNVQLSDADGRPILSLKDAEASLALFKGLAYGDEMTIASGLTLRFFDAGHILDQLLGMLQLRATTGHHDTADQFLFVA